MEQKESNRISSVIDTAIRNLSNLIDTNVVVGKPIDSIDGEIVLPVSKATLGYLSGGGEYGKTGIFKKSSDLPFSAGNGGIVSIKPCGFLIKDKLGNYKILSMDGQVDKLIDKVSDYLVNLEKDFQ